MYGSMMKDHVDGGDFTEVDHYCGHDWNLYDIVEEEIEVMAIDVSSLFIYLVIVGFIGYAIFKYVSTNQIGEGDDESNID